MATPRFYAIAGRDPDPGPVPPDDAREAADPRRFPNNDSILREEAVHRSWAALVRAVRASGDRDAIQKLGTFRLAIERFLA